MTVTTCDLCSEIIPRLEKVIRIRVLGEIHPHDGCRMERVIDCCAACAAEVPELETSVVFDELKRKIGNGEES